MNFFGDVNLPTFNKEKTNIPRHILSNNNIFNFESVCVEEQKASTRGIALSSNQESVEKFCSLGFNIAGLANNHISDFDDSISETIKFLGLNNIRNFGAGSNISEASRYIRVEEQDEEYYVIGAGWDVIGCQYADKKRAGINPYSSQELKQSVCEILKINNNAKIFCFFHYNYEFEEYPQPADRKLFHELIDMGVEGIIGHHSHVVGPYESYNGKYIFYSLGNFFMPKVVTRGYNVVYPERAYEGISVEYLNNKVKIHWYKNIDDYIEYYKTEDIEHTTLVNLTRKVGTDNYLNWFSKNRIKSKLLPIFKDYDKNNLFNSNFVKFRNFTINMAVKFRVKR
ncbi:CapA family protein [Vibrio sp. 10N.239.311.D11]|uniref:CapA family protein n=1 Tax=Vibrio sp. 10N.239.311.D11 TaxID=3229975 RepID=UPI0035527548